MDVYDKGLLLQSLSFWTLNVNHDDGKCTNVNNFINTPFTNFKILNSLILITYFSSIL
jgi:hypothetical protein